MKGGLALKKIVAFWLLVFTAFVSVCAEDGESAESAKYYVNGRLLTEMTFEEIYDLEDTLVYALKRLFNEDQKATESGEFTGLYVVNPRTKKYHYPWCNSALQIGSDRFFEQSTSSVLTARQFKPCGNCISGKSEYIEDGRFDVYSVNERSLTDMSIPELYDFEDALVSALTVIFNKDIEETAAGELIGCYVINEKTKKFHYPWCYSALQIEPDKRSFERCAPSDLANPSRPDAQNYTPCGSCRPHVNG